MEALLSPVEANDAADRHLLYAQEVEARVVDSIDLLNGAREIRIRHGESLYRLRVTASEKLILTK